jgi:hypothetical protein
MFIKRSAGERVTVVPAQAGTQRLSSACRTTLGPRLRGGDGK